MCCTPVDACFFLTGSNICFESFSVFRLSVDNKGVFELVSQLLEKLVLPGDLLVVGLDLLADLKHVFDDPVLLQSKRLSLIIESKDVLDIFVELRGAKVRIDLLKLQLLQRLLVFLQRRGRLSLDSNRDLFHFRFLAKTFVDKSVWRLKMGGRRLVVL